MPLSHRQAPGKLQHAKKVALNPLLRELKNKIKENVVIDETSTSGLFNHYVAGSTVPILCVDEAYSLLNKLTSNTKSVSQTHLSMERLCKCYDGDFWYVLKGNKGKRVGVPLARLAMLAFTTPHQFLENVWPKIVSAKNGLSDRILLFYQKREGEIDLEEMAMHCELLADYNVKSLGDVFEKMFIEHNGKAPVQYKLTASAKELFFKCSKPNEDVPLTQGAATGGSLVRAPGSKKTKNTLRIALNMHVLYHCLSKALALESGPTPPEITAPTMQMAIAFVEALETIKGISEISCSLKNSLQSVKVGVSFEDLKKRVLSLPGPFTAVRRLVRSVSLTRRPSSQVAQEVMIKLQAVGIGSVVHVSK